jgi:hypothetical protein
MSAYFFDIQPALRLAVKTYHRLLPLYIKASLAEADYTSSRARKDGFKAAKMLPSYQSTITLHELTTSTLGIFQAATKPSRKPSI